MTTLRLLAVTAAAVALASPARAGNIDVSTIPARDSVQLTIYNTEDLTLVRETRHVTFSEGLNPLQFSWANTLIDPSSVDLRFRTHGTALTVLDTTFPHDRPQMLIWNVESEMEGEAVVEISYFTSGITWEADYTCIAEPGGTTTALEGFVRITNGSGEDYRDAQVRFVVGTINLVERIAELARRGVVSRDDLDAYKSSSRFRGMRNEARRAAGALLAAEMDVAAQAPKQIVKEGLSEYFIFTIEGTETVPNAWSKRMRLFAGATVPFATKYCYRPAEFGDQLVRLLVMRNDEASGLGASPLPNGVVRAFRANEPGGLSYVAAHAMKYVPIGQRIELNLGPDPKVVHEHVRLRSWRDGFWFRSTNGQTYFSLDHQRRVRHDDPVAGWDEHARWVDRIRNDRDEPIDIEVRRSFHGHVIFDSEHDPTLHDYRTPRIDATIPARTRRDLEYGITVRNGINATQDNVTIAG